MNFDVMLKALLKAVGFDPQTFIPQFQRFIAGIAEQVKGFDARLSIMDQKLDRIGDHLHYIKPMMNGATCEPDPALLPPPLEGVNITQDKMQ